MEDKKSSLYSLSGRIKNGWTQGGSYSRSVSEQETRELDLTFEPAPQIILPVAEEYISSTVIPETQTVIRKEALNHESEAITERQKWHKKPECQMVGIVAIVKQDWEDVYEPDLGFERGTIFPDLDLPFVGEGACRYD